MKINKKDIYSRVADYIAGNELLLKGERVLLSMSAGKDSMMLLNVFLRLKQDLPLDFGIFHLNHMMRAEESDEDEKFIAEIAGAANIRLFSFKFDFTNNMPQGSSFEEFARLKRYELLEHVRTENNFHKIATAHNRDDNIETILMRIFTGTGIHGLTGIKPQRGNIIRPLLFLSTEEIYEYLRENKIQWREDSSNRDGKYLRNFVRNTLLPEIKTRFENAGDALLSLSSIAGEYSLIIDEFLENSGKQYALENNSVVIENEKCINNKKLFKYIISKAIREKFGLFVTEDILEEIFKKAVANKSHLLLYENSNLSIKKTLKNNKKVIVISRNIEYKFNISEWEYRIDINHEGEGRIFLKEISKTIHFKLVDYNYFLKNKNQHGVFVSLDNDHNEIIIRNRRDGDRIKLEHGSKKIKDLLIENKLEKHVKDSVPLIVVNAGIAAFMPVIMGVSSNRVASDFHVKSDSKKILAIQSG